MTELIQKKSRNSFVEGISGNRVMPQQSLHNTEGTKRERHPDLFASLLQFDNPQDGEYVYTYIYIKEI